MTNKNEKRKGFLAILLLLCTVTVTLRTLALFLNFDPISGYFEGKTFINIAGAMVIGGSVLFLGALFSVKKDERLIASFSTPATYIPTGLMAAAIIMMAFHSVSGLNIKGLSGFISALKNPMVIIAIFLFILGILAVCHFILNALITRRSSTERAALGLCAVGFFALYSIYLYFTKELPLNAPNKLVDQMAYLFSALFFLYETRISIGREKWGAYMAFGLISSLLTAYSAIPAFIYYIFSGNTVSNSLYEIALTLALFVFISCRLVLAFGLMREEESSFVTALKRKEAVAEAASALTREERFAYLNAAEADAEEAEITDGEAELEIEILTEDEGDAEMEVEIILEGEDMPKISENGENSAENGEKASENSENATETVENTTETNAESEDKAPSEEDSELGKISAEIPEITAAAAEGSES